MNTQDIVAIIALVLSILGTIFMLGQQAQKISESAKDLDHLFTKIRENNDRLSELEKAFIRSEQRITFLENKVYGDDTIARVRNNNA